MIRLHNVSKEYHLGQVPVHALRGIDIDIEQGSLVGLSGPSGSGKSTLLNIIGLMDQASSGEVAWFGKEVHSLNNHQLVDLRRHDLGVIFQNFNLNPVMTAFENVEYSLLLLGVAKKERQAQVLAMLDAVGLLEQRDQRPDQLSGGQQQRVAIARALVKQPKVIVADEPTAALDSKNRQQVLKLMHDLCLEKGATLIMATHDAESLAICQRVVEMCDGQIVNEYAQEGGI